MNKVLIIGRLTKDPETKVTSNNAKYARFTVAVTRPFGEDQADFIPVVAWRSQAEFVEKYMTKGALVSIEGRFQSSNYTNSEGTNIVRYDVAADRVQSLETKSARQNREGQVQEFKTPISQAATQIIKFEAESKPKEEKTNTDIPWELDL